MNTDIAMSNKTSSRKYAIVAMGLAVLAIAVFAGFEIKRHFFPEYWVAEDLGPIQINSAAAPGSAPEGMVWIPGGTFWMGSEHFPDAKPVHKAYVDGFWMDKTEVTNAQFRRFVEDTGYVTVAEKPPDLAEIMKQAPGTSPPPPADLVPGSLVFAQPASKVTLNDVRRWWKWTPGASWRHPWGPASDLRNLDNHPVVHVGFRDAIAFCEWRSKKEGATYRLPTEAEWEFAARGGLDRKPFVWGDEFKPNGKLMANTWQGDFPHHNTLEDGYLGTAPVGSFPPNGFGLADMAGNVWEWCGDWYRPRYSSAYGDRNPRGPASSFDPDEPDIPKRVQRGGSFLCWDNYCARYMPGGRGKGELDNTTNHVGFRCVKAVR